jgi:hypothetical protein
MKDNDELWLTCVFSKTRYPALPLPAYPNWVADADGTAVRYLGNHPYSTLHNPLTGATTSVSTVLDLNNWKYTRPKGVLFGDGTILLYYTYRIEEEDDEGARATRFSVALLRPGNAAAWTVIERTLEASEYGKFCVAYLQGGKILVSVGASQWHVVTPNDDVASDVMIPSPWTPAEREKYFYWSGHVMESRGELLWASILFRNTCILEDWRRDVGNLVQALSLSVYTLQEEGSASAPKKMQWVRKDSLSLADRVMFLGWPNSFAVDASRLNCDGGCAYFVYTGRSLHYEWSAVFRYNLIENKAEFVDWLPQGWHDDKCAWLIPQPTISPIHAYTM